MSQVLTHPAGVGPALQASGTFLHVIGETRGLSRERRLSIYANGYFSRIVEAMGANYSSVKNALGDEAFDELARAYLIKHPSTFKSIDDVGHLLADFLKGKPVAKKFPFLPDLARLEWAAHQCFFADDTPPGDLKQFKNLPAAGWQRVRFELDPSVRFLKLDWPVDALWRDDGAWDKRRLKNVRKERLLVMVFRQPDKLVRVPRLAPAQYDLLTALASGKTLRQALQAIMKRRSSRKNLPPVQTWFRQWVEDGVIKKINYGSDRPALLS